MIELREMITFCGYAEDKRDKGSNFTGFYEFDNLSDLEREPMLFRKVNASSQLTVES